MNIESDVQEVGQDVGVSFCIRCMDDLPRKIEREPQICLPGGVLFPELCVADQDDSMGEFMRELMMGLIVRKVKEYKGGLHLIRILGHYPCRVASDLGLSRVQVQAKLLNFSCELKKRYPEVKVSVWFETHSDCGSEHRGHVHLGTT